MTIFYTQTASHLIKNTHAMIGNCTIKKFSDGEIYVKVNQEVNEVWVIASTFPPSDNLVELFFLLDALQRKNAKINLLMPYFGYARQSHPQPGEAASAHVICNFLKTFDMNRIVIIHIHTQTVKEFLSFENVIPFDLLCKEADQVDAIAASDKGSAALATETGIRCSKPTIYIEKIRPSHEAVEIISVKGTVEGKKILIVDDIIATGSTVMAAAQQLKDLGAQAVFAYATHAIFSRDALQKINESALERIFVTNTIPQRPPLGDKVKVLDIAPLIEKITGA